MRLEKPRKLPRQERSRLLVARILDATARILSTRGYAGLSTNAVAEAAEISIGSLYQYFPNRDALVAAVVERHGERVYRMIMDEAGALPRSLAEAVQQMVAGVIAAHRLDPHLHAVLESEMPKLRIFDGHAATVKAISDRLGALPPTIAAGLRVRGLAQSASVVGEMVHALVHSVLIHPSESSLSPADLERETVLAVIAYLTAPVG